MSYKKSRPPPIFTKYDENEVYQIFMIQFRKSRQLFKHVLNAEGFIKYKGAQEDEGHIIRYYRKMQREKKQFHSMGPFDLISSETVALILDKQLFFNKYIERRRKRMRV